MTTQHESDPTAVEQTIEILGNDVIDEIARVAQQHNVIVNINIMPNSENTEANNT